jgi:hypothetical protein
MTIQTLFLIQEEILKRLLLDGKLIKQFAQAEN